MRLRLYISGDTLVHDDLHRVAERYPDIDLGLFHLGGTSILGILVTMDAEQGVRAIRIVNPREAIPIHYNDYRVFRSTLDEFKAAVAAAGLGDRVRYLALGETYQFQVPDVPDMLRELPNQIGLSGHFAFLNASQVSPRTHVEGTPRGFLSDQESYRTVLLAHHHAPREAHALLVPAHVAAVDQEAQRQAELNCTVEQGEYP